MLVVFVAVALVSGGALGWLGWLLLAQDAALDGQRRQEALDQAADRAAAAMQRSIADLRSRTSAEPDPTVQLPAGVSRISLAPGVVCVWPEDSLLYTRFAPATLGHPKRSIEESGTNSPTAISTWRRRALATVIGNPAVRAGALARLARVRRKQHDARAALVAYEQLADRGRRRRGTSGHAGRDRRSSESVFDAEGRLSSFAGKPMRFAWTSRVALAARENRVRVLFHAGGALARDKANSRCERCGPRGCSQLALAKAELAGARRARLTRTPRRPDAGDMAREPNGPGCDRGGTSLFRLAL
jgi:hypothetical protein